MSARMLIVDGYNLLHAAGWAQLRYGPGELEACRTRLLRFLNERLSPFEAMRTTVVFDARHPPVAAPRFMTHGYLRVLFASPHGDADRMIEELLENSSAPRNITVVSSDRRLHLAARHQQAASVTSADFLDSLRTRDAQDLSPLSQRPRAEKPDTVSDPAELQFWLRVFGDISLALPDVSNDPLLSPPRPAPAPSTPSKSETSRPRTPASDSKQRPGPRPRGVPKSRQAHSKSEPVKMLSTDVTEWLAWAAEVQAWLDNLP